jgi:hypothetical protein
VALQCKGYLRLAPKNYYGSGSLASAKLTDKMHSILGTLEMWGINSNLWLTSYLETCAKNKGCAPKNIDEFLPWKMSDQRLEQLGSGPKSRPVPYSKITEEEIKCATVDEFFVKKKSNSSDKSFVICQSQNTDSPSQKRSASG